jgi:hypothetical protein
MSRLVKDDNSRVARKASADLNQFFACLATTVGCLVFKIVQYLGAQAIGFYFL